MLSTAAACADIEDVWCSWKLDSSTARTSSVGSVAASTTGVPTLPTATAFSPAARRIDSSMPTVVVFPLVPVTASHGAGPPPPARSTRTCHASSTSLHTGTSCSRAATRSGWCGGSPGDATTRSARSSTVPASSSAEPMTSSAWSSTGTTRAPRDARISTAARPETPSPATTTRAPSSTREATYPATHSA